MSIVFSYKATDSEGKAIEGTVEAENKESALGMIQGLKEKGLKDIAIQNAEVVEESVEAAVSGKVSTKKCPFCAEEILAEALKCKHCGEMLKKEQTGEEKILKELRPCFRAYLFSFRYFFGPAIGTSILFGVGGPAGIMFGLMIVIPIFWAMAFVNRFNFRYKITNKRIVTEVGIVANNRNEIDISHIRSVNVRQGFMQGIMDCGHVLIGTSGTAGYEIILKDVDSPSKIVELIKKLQQ